MDIVTTPSVHVVGDDGPTTEGDLRVAVGDESARPTPSGRDGTDLRRHIPRIALDWDDDAPDRAWQQIDASLVFADISGFTALTEKLARRGRIGAEELIETLNRVFGAMLTQAAIRGGELLKFGGDALLFTFRGDDHEARACRSAVDMRQALREAAKVPTSVGRLKLSMSVGIHSGPVDFFLVGAPTRELLILGDAGTSTAEAEHAAVAGEILVTEGTARHLPPGSTDLRDDGLHKLKWRFTYPPEGEGPPTPDVSQERILGLFPHALGDYLADRVPDPEHKVATIGFARFSGTDRMLREEGHDAVARVLEQTMAVFEEAMIAEGISLLATDIDSDGGKLFMASGVPYTTEDDEGSMLRAMRRVLDTGTPLPVQIGVNRGHVFVAEVGTLNRSAYSAMGDTTNTAARIMSKAGAGVLFAHPEVTENSRTLFATEVAGPFPMKGKAVPVLVHEVGPDLGTREALHRTSLPLAGREVELATVRGALERALSGEGGVVTVAAGTGLGKSRLIHDAMDGLEATVVTVRAEPYGMTSPYRMLRDPLREAFGVARDEPDAMTAAFLASVQARMPDQIGLAPLLADVLSVPVPESEESRSIDPQYRPERIADLVVQVIETSVRGPFVLLVEEGHWADASSIAVLRRIAAATAGRPWALVVARRAEGEGLDLDLGTRVELPPLEPEVLRRAIADGTRDAPLLPHELDGIVARAQGNPLFAEELLRLFREAGSLESLPESLYAALDAEIDALDNQARRALRYASVLGRSFRRSVLDETLRADDVDVDAATLDRLRELPGARRTAPPALPQLDDPGRGLRGARLSHAGHAARRSGTGRGAAVQRSRRRRRHALPALLQRRDPGQGVAVLASGRRPRDGQVRVRRGRAVLPPGAGCGAAAAGRVLARPTRRPPLARRRAPATRLLPGCSRRLPRRATALRRPVAGVRAVPQGGGGAAPHAAALARDADAHPLDPAARRGERGRRDRAAHPSSPRRVLLRVVPGCGAVRSRTR